MASTRREKIESMLRDDPNDVFLRYSLALEMEGAGEWEAGLEILESIARSTPSNTRESMKLARRYEKESRRHGGREIRMPPVKWRNS